MIFGFTWPSGFREDILTHTHTHTHTHIQTDRQKDRHTYIHTYIHTTYTLETLYHLPAYIHTLTREPSALNKPTCILAHQNTTAESFFQMNKYGGGGGVFEGKFEGHYIFVVGGGWRGCFSFLFFFVLFCFLFFVVVFFLFLFFFLHS